MLQLNPILPVLIKKTPESEWEKGYAHFLIDYSEEHYLFFTVFLDSDGSCWTVDNRYLRIQNNITLGRNYGSNMAKV